MRLTFPSLSSTGSTYLFQVAALATLPTIANVVAKRMLSPFISNCHKVAISSHVVSLLSAATLVRNPWALGSSALIFMLYRASSSPAKRTTRRPREQEITKWNTIPLTSLAIALMNKIESASGPQEAHKIYRRPDDTGATTAFLQLGDHDFSKHIGPIDPLKLNLNTFSTITAANILKKLFLRLDPPLLGGLQQDFVRIHGEDALLRNSAFEEIFEHLPQERQELLAAILHHLNTVSSTPKYNLDKDDLARIFLTYFFGDKFTQSPGLLAAALAYLISNPKLAV